MQPVWGSTERYVLDKNDLGGGNLNINNPEATIVVSEPQTTTGDISIKANNIVTTVDGNFFARHVTLEASNYLILAGGGKMASFNIKCEKVFPINPNLFIAKAVTFTKDELMVALDATGFTKGGAKLLEHFQKQGNLKSEAEDKTQAEKKGDASSQPQSANDSGKS